MTLQVAVLIVSYDSAAYIGRCLSALAASTYAAFSVVICENAGPAAYDRLARAVPAKLAGGQPVSLHLAPGNLGFAGGVNFCMGKAPAADAYWLLNPDAEATPSALALMVERLSRGDCSIVGHDLILPEGVLASRGGGRWARWTARAISLDHGLPRDPQPLDAQTEQRMTYAIGASMLVSRAFIDAVGPLREDYFLYCEEVEWSLRAKRLGQKLGYAPGALVLHAHGAATGGGGGLGQRSKIAVYLVERNRLLLTRDLFPLFLISAVPTSLVHLLVKYGKARAWRQLGYGLAGWWAGVGGERGAPQWFDRPAQVVEGDRDCSKV
jgi:GT2 family glycosyltransferase